MAESQNSAILSSHLSKIAYGGCQNIRHSTPPWPIFDNTVDISKLLKILYDSHYPKKNPESKARSDYSYQNRQARKEHIQVKTIKCTKSNSISYLT